MPLTELCLKKKIVFKNGIQRSGDGVALLRQYYRVAKTKKKFVCKHQIEMFGFLFYFVVFFLKNKNDFWFGIRM